MKQLTVGFALAVVVTAASQAAEIPHVQKNHGAWQLMVELCASELHSKSGSV